MEEPMPEPADPWHPYRSSVEEHLGTCTDYLGRLRRSLAREIAPDRHYFTDKAHQLHAATRRMVRLVQDIDSWLGDCPAQTDHLDPDGERYVVDCTLPAGHEGPHHDGDRLLPGRRLTGELRDLADAVERISQQFGWNAATVDRDLARAPGAANGPDALANLATNLDTIARRAARLAADVRRTALPTPAPVADTLTDTTQRRHSPSAGSPALGL
jgi:hypothetical protein